VVVVLVVPRARPCVAPVVAVEVEVLGDGATFVGDLVGDGFGRDLGADPALTGEDELGAVAACRVLAGRVVRLGFDTGPGSIRAAGA
jgi:hypothetical protein